MWPCSLVTPRPTSRQPWPVMRKSSSTGRRPAGRPLVRSWMWVLIIGVIGAFREFAVLRALQFAQKRRIRRVRRLLDILWQRRLKEVAEILLQLGVRIAVDVEHMSGGIKIPHDVLVHLRTQSHVVERVLRGEVWSRQI